MNTPVANLLGRALDWAVAHADGHEITHDSINPLVTLRGRLSILGPATAGQGHECGYSPSNYWTCGGPIIDRAGISVAKTADGWRAELPGAAATGPSALVAAMRCYVAARLGASVDVPNVIQRQ